MGNIETKKVYHRKYSIIIYGDNNKKAIVPIGKKKEKYSDGKGYLWEMDAITTQFPSADSFFTACYKNKMVDFVPTKVFITSNQKNARLRKPVWNDQVLHSVSCNLCQKEDPESIRVFKRSDRIIYDVFNKLKEYGNDASFIRKIRNVSFMTSKALTVYMRLIKNNKSSAVDPKLNEEIEKTQNEILNYLRNYNELRDIYCVIRNYELSLTKKQDNIDGQISLDDVLYEDGEDYSDEVIISIQDFVHNFDKIFPASEVDISNEDKEEVKALYEEKKALRKQILPSILEQDLKAKGLDSLYEDHYEELPYLTQEQLDYINYDQEKGMKKRLLN